MLRIKSAQYMSMPQPMPMPMPAPMPKALPEEQPDPQWEIYKCKLCQNSTNADLDEGFCQDCIAQGDVKDCNNCGSKFYAEDPNAERCEMCSEIPTGDEFFQHPSADNNIGMM